MKKQEMTMVLQEVRKASFAIAKLSKEKKEALLLMMAKELQTQKEGILLANKKDVEHTEKQNKSAAFIDRLRLTDAGFDGMVEQLVTVAHLADPIGETIEERRLPNGVHLQKKRFPLGVIFMIYESRPNVTVDVAGLCLKSGNAVILKGGSEAYHTNKILVACLHTALRKFAIPVAAVTFHEQVTHEDVRALLKRSDLIDVVIPRGSYALTTSVAKNSRIPILYHASGGARMYIDTSADLDQALMVAVNAKTQRTGVCNALDMILVHKDCVKTFLPKLDNELSKKHFQIRADKRAKAYMPHAIAAHQKDFSTEFLDSIVAVKTVDSAEEAITFIQKYTHGHTEILMSQNTQVINAFITDIDAAGLMINCSSRLHDGGQFGMGAEMGTATGKLHARGPVGVRELTTYKWIAYGNGQIRQ